MCPHAVEQLLQGFAVLVESSKITFKVYYDTVGMKAVINYNNIFVQAT